MPGHDNTGEWAYRYAINFYLLLAEIPVSDDLQDLLLHLFRYPKIRNYHSIHD